LPTEEHQAGSIWRIARQEDQAVAAVVSVLSSHIDSDIVRLKAIILADQMGPAAKPALPLLVKALNHQDLAKAARRALASVDPEGRSWT
jgi:hypothetical protein